MSVYSRGDRARDGDDKEKKKDLGDEIGEAFQNVGKGFASLFGGGKEKKWDKKGGGNVLGTAADAEAARQARLAALEASSAGSSSAAPPPSRQQRPPSAAASAALSAAEARAAGGGGAARPPARAPPPPAASSSGASSFPGPGYCASPRASDFASEAQLMVDMGFARDAATSALAATGGDVERAVVKLSEGGGPPPPAADGASDAARRAAATATTVDVVRLATELSGTPGGGASLTLLRKLVGNVRDAPHEAKYRRVRLTNEKIAVALGGRAHTSSIALLAACGFRLPSGADHAEMDDAMAMDAAALEWACAALDTAIEVAATGGPPVPRGPADVKVLYAAGGGGMRFDNVGDDFYALTPAEVKALMDANAAKRAQAERFLTKEAREAEKARSRRMYRKALIRVRLPDGLVLQATFAASAPVSAVFTWVQDSLREPGHAFELSMARGQPLQDMSATLEQAELAPATLLNFRCPTAELLDPPYLTDALMAQVQTLTTEALPEAVTAAPARLNPLAVADSATPRGGGGGADGPRGPPRWMQ